jgi:hypothetical protein
MKQIQLNSTVEPKSSALHYAAPRIEAVGEIRRLTAGVDTEPIIEDDTYKCIDSAVAQRVR